MNIAWAAIAGLVIVFAVGLVALVGLAMTRSDRDLRGFVDSSVAIATLSIWSGGGRAGASDEALPEAEAEAAGRERRPDIFWPTVPAVQLFTKHRGIE